MYATHHPVAGGGAFLSTMSLCPASSFADRVPLETSIQSSVLSSYNTHMYIERMYCLQGFPSEILVGQSPCVGSVV